MGRQTKMALKDTFDFHVGALPRSGTAWVSTALNMYHGVFCFHDALTNVNCPYRSIPNNVHPYNQLGDSSSGCCLFPEMSDRKIYIVRHPDDVRSSMRDVGILDENFDQIYDICTSWGEQADLTVQFKALFSDDGHKANNAFSAILEAVNPDLVMDETKWKTIKKLNVQIHNLTPEGFNFEEIRRNL